MEINLTPTPRVTDWKATVNYKGTALRMVAITTGRAITHLAFNYEDRHLSMKLTIAESEAIEAAVTEEILKQII